MRTRAERYRISIGGFQSSINEKLTSGSHSFDRSRVEGFDGWEMKGERLSTEELRLEVQTDDVGGDVRVHRAHGRVIQCLRVEFVETEPAWISREGAEEISSMSPSRQSSALRSP